jgi:hypothetical protein
MTPEELKRRSEPLMPNIHDALAHMESEGAAAIIHREDCAAIIAGLLFSFVDGIDEFVDRLEEARAVKREDASGLCDKRVEDKWSGHRCIHDAGHEPPCHFKPPDRACASPDCESTEGLTQTSLGLLCEECTSAAQGASR